MKLLTLKNTLQEQLRKVRKLMGWVRRCFSNRHPDFMKTVWRIYSPILTMQVRLWSPGSSPELQNLEAHQRIFTSWILGTEKMNYWERLQFLHLNSVEMRFERYKIIFTWKHLEGLVPHCGIQGRVQPTHWQTLEDSYFPGPKISGSDH